MKLLILLFITRDVSFQTFSITVMDQGRHFKRKSNCGDQAACWASLTVYLPLQERWGKTAAVETPQPLPDQSQQRSELCCSCSLFTSLLLFFNFVEQETSLIRNVVHRETKRDRLSHPDIDVTHSLSLVCVYYVWLLVASLYQTPTFARFILFFFFHLMIYYYLGVKLQAWQTEKKILFIAVSDGWDVKGRKRL